MLVWTFGSQRAGGEGLFSPTTVVSGVELGVSGMAASAFATFSYLTGTKQG